MDNAPKICFIGSGNLATQLSVALHEKGFPIVQVYSRTDASARMLAERLECDYTTDVRMLTLSADLYICALKDSVVTEVLDQTEGRLRDKVIVHTAGSLPMDLLASYSSKVGVLYPMQTFSKAKQVDFTKVPFLLEGSDREVYTMLDSVVSALSEHRYEVTSDNRKRIHLAAVFASNFANHSYALAAELTEQSGLPFEVLLPLIDETAEKVHSLPPREAQSGPAVRYDQNVMAMHKSMLEDRPMMKKVYELMSDSIHALSIKDK